MLINNNNYTAFVGSTPLVENTAPLGSSQNTNATSTVNFGDMLGKELQKNEEQLKFSKHAQNRISQRSIDLSPELMEQVTNAVNNAQEKGITDALILGSNNAFIVNVPTRTVITTMNSNEMKENIITNIDGTVII